MARIIIYGDINFLPLYVSVDGGKEITISGKCPRSITIPAGSHRIFATTVSKLERRTNGFLDNDFLSTATLALQNSTNTTIEGQLNFGSTDVLLIQVEQVGMKTKVYNKLVSDAEVNDYIHAEDVLDYKEREAGQKNKWVVLLLCFFFGVFGVHRFYEKKIFTGIVYLLTLGLFGFGVLIDFFKILFRPA